ncbi:hypothetical protein NF27_EY00530 [Candidatus Jidaibacter acanthamoeba]|uniref:Uncharacterized protein n=1 Tax=Candidatus Jidaibacter acanthamoebae TaxID=86105 RepID=A0A0C1MSD1_9RICK|nr:hypothetical protein [Candidatus Jidaibacter acanthamoeba]KIE04957.1 hypothetical protein NF27_EY00530 [Candidatus Jidaibacter acanthamoeba]
MKRKYIVIIASITLIYTVFWGVCANNFKHHLESELKKNDITYESISITGTPISIGSKVHKPSIEINKNLSLKSNDIATVKADLFGQKYTLLLPKLVEIIHIKNEEISNNLIDFKNAEFTIGFKNKPIKNYKVDYFEQFELPASKEFEALKLVAFKADEVAVFNNENKLLLKNHGFSFKTDFEKIKLPVIKADTELTYNGIKYEDEFFSVENDPNIKDFSQMVKFILTSNLYDNLKYKLNFKTNILHDDNIGKYKYGFDIISNTNIKDIANSQQTSTVNINAEKNKVINITTNYHLTSNYTPKWFDASLEYNKKIYDINPYIKSINIKDIHNIIPKMHEFKYINFDLNTEFSFLLNSTDLAPTVKINKLGFETEQYAAYVEGIIAEATDKPVEMFLYINNYNQLFNDYINYGNKILEAMQVKDIDIDSRKAIVIDTLIGIAEEKDNSKMKIRVSYDKTNNELLIGGKNLFEIVMLFEPWNKDLPLLF